MTLYTKTLKEIFEALHDKDNKRFYNNDNYGEARARSILSGFSTNICFRVNDAESRSYIQGLFGKNQKTEAYVPINQRSGIVQAQREANVVEDWDISRLKTGEAIIGLPGHEPVIFQFDRY